MNTYQLTLELNGEGGVTKEFSVRVNEGATWMELLEDFCDGLFAMGFCAKPKDVLDEARDYEADRSAALGKA
jgi:hypothetical protein